MNRTALSDSSQATGEFSRDAVENRENHIDHLTKSGLHPGRVG